MRPQLSTLYQTKGSLPDQPPIILLHGVFGGRLCDANKQEHWPGGLLDLLFDDYANLALSLGSKQFDAKDTLKVCGLADNVGGQDFYGKLEATLTGAGGYQLAQAGVPIEDTQRRYYHFLYDWRQDNSKTAAALNRLVEQIRTDHGVPNLRVDIVAHSMGGLVTRYWLRYGATDVLSSNDFPINNQGWGKVRKVILVGTPNLGSASALQQLLKGAKFGINKIEPEVLMTFPSAYQLLPHPIFNVILDSNGEPLARDIFDIDIWRALEWGPFDPKIRTRLQIQGWAQGDLLALEAYAELHIERARRFVWSLTVNNPESPSELIVFGGDCATTPARILIEDLAGESSVRLWPDEIKSPRLSIDYQALMLEPGDGAVTKASLLARTELDPSIPRHRFSDFPLDYAVMFCEDHSQLTGNITFQDNLLHVLLSR